MIYRYIKNCNYESGNAVEYLRMAIENFMVMKRVAEENDKEGLEYYEFMIGLLKSCLDGFVLMDDN